MSELKVVESQQSREVYRMEQARTMDVFYWAGRLCMRVGGVSQKNAVLLDTGLLRWIPLFEEIEPVTAAVLTVERA